MYAGNIQSIYGGVHVGAVAYNFPDLPRIPGAPDDTDAWIKVFQDVGFGEMELSNNILEPPVASLLDSARSPTTAGQGAVRGGPTAPGAAGAAPPAAPGSRPPLTPEEQQQAKQEAREKLRQWRLTTPMSHFQDVRKKFDRAGIRIHVYTCNGMGDDFSEAEIDRQFLQAKALGVKILASSTRLPVAKKLIPFAEKYKMTVAFHGHANIEDPNEFATPESFQKAWEMSKRYMANLDIGHFTAANFDAVAFIEKNHARITHVHIKDRKKNQGPNVPWGQGDTPIKEVLQLVKKNRYPIHCYQEFEYRVPVGSSSAAEWKKCREYLIRALA